MKRVLCQGFTLSLLVLLFCLSGLLLLASFLSKKEAPVTFKFPVVIQGEESATLCLSPQYMMNAWYNMERVMKIRDTIDLRKEARQEGIEYFQFEDAAEWKKSKYSNAGLKIIADTVTELSMLKQPIWASYLFHRRFNDKYVVLQDDTLVQYVKSYPIYIVNLSPTRTARLETQDGSIMMVLEAQNTKHSWQPVEYWSHSWCGNSYFTMTLAPEHMVLTRGVRCSGDMRTKCRLHVTNGKEELYSNEFYMSINESQFEKPKEED